MVSLQYPRKILEEADVFGFKFMSSLFTVLDQSVILFLRTDVKLHVLLLKRIRTGASVDIVIPSVFSGRGRPVKL